jgi:hypothetical protein
MTMSGIKRYEFELERQFAVEEADTIMIDSPPILREKLEWVRACFQDEWRRSFLIRYQIAVVIRDIYDDVKDNKGKMYGAKAVDAIKKMLGWDDGVIYQAINVANAFTPEEIEKVTQMRLPGGRPLSFGHVVVLYPSCELRSRHVG